MADDTKDNMVTVAVKSENHTHKGIQVKKGAKIEVRKENVKRLTADNIIEG